jgi:hypothetical protein
LNEGEFSASAIVPLAIILLPDVLQDRPGPQGPLFAGGCPKGEAKS